MTDDGSEVQSLPRRPGSSRYHILPSIGQTSHAPASENEAHLHTELDGEKSWRTAEPSSRKNAHGRDRASTKSRSRLPKHVTMTGKHGSDTESESNERGGNTKRSQPSVPLVDEQVALAVKLPSGQRIEHRFQPNEKLFSVLHYVETVTQQDFTNCEFVSADRRTVLTDLNRTIALSGVLSRSVLYLQLPDET